jgi:hypothetical protein
MTPPAAAAPAVQPHPRRAPAPGRPYSPRPRRVSGPARPTRAPGRERGAPGRSGGRDQYTGIAGIALGIGERLQRLSTHPMLDRLIRGRTWIAIVAFALIGIVTLQLGLLKLNAGIGHSLGHEANLQRENAALSIENSELAAGDVVESSAGRLGMEVVPVGALRFLTAHPGGDAGHGAAALKAPLASASTAAPTPEASSGSTGTESAAEGAKSGSSGSSGSSGEASAQPGEPSTSSESTASSTSESKEAKPAPSEPSASGRSSEAASEERTSSAAAAPPAGGGSTEPSGGTQAATAGR